MEAYEGVSAECTLCGGEIYTGEAYYHINGSSVCQDCLPKLARQLLAPFLIEEA